MAKWSCKGYIIWENFKQNGLNINVIIYIFEAILKIELDKKKLECYFMRKRYVQYDWLILNINSYI